MEFYNIGVEAKQVSNRNQSNKLKANEVQNSLLVWHM